MKAAAAIGVLAVAGIAGAWVWLSRVSAEVQR